jgi:hypothetical protein
MSHNTKSYRKKNKSTSEGCKKIETLFKHVIISSTPDTSGKLLHSPEHGKNEENTIGDSHLTESASYNQSPACSDDNKDDSENDSKMINLNFFLMQDNN